MIPGEAVEAAAKAHHSVMAGGGPGEWGYLDKQSQDNRLYWMHAALEAAAPHMLAAAWDEGYMCSYDQERGGNGDGPNPIPGYLAEDLAQWNPYRPAP